MYGYICKACDFCTETKNTFKRHFNSKKHKENVEDNVTDEINMIPTYICVECLTTFTNEQNLKRHVSDRCKVIKKKYTMLSKKDAEISELKKKVENITEKFFDLSSNCIELSKKCIDSNLETCKGALALMKLVFEKIPDAPKLQSPDNILNKLDENEQSDKEIIHNYKNKSLHEYIGDFIVQEYRKKDPLDQSMWSTDTLRFTYIVMEEEWTRDKNGEKIIDKIILKIIDKIREINKNFIIKCSYVTSTKNDIKSKHKIKISDDHYLWDNSTKQIGELMSLSMDLDKKIDTNNLCKQVLKYISPKFAIVAREQEIKNNIL